MRRQNLQDEVRKKNMQTDGCKNMASLPQQANGCKSAASLSLAEQELHQN